MLINNIFKQDTLVTIVLPNNILDSEIALYVYISGDSKDTLEYVIEQGNNFKFISFNTPTYDCMVILKYANRTEFIRVGTPPVYLLLSYVPYKNEDIQYTQYDYNENILNNGYMVDLGDNIYVAPKISVVKSYYLVANGITTFTLPDSYNIGSGIESSEIVLNRGNWQLIALPLEGDVATLFVDKLAKQENVLDTDLIEICSAYPGQINKFLSYIPGFTDRSSEQNFQLTYTDDNVKEITAFWVKCKKWTHRTDDIKFSW